METNDASPCFAAQLSQSYGGDIISRRREATLADCIVVYVAAITCLHLAGTASDTVKAVICIVVVSSYYLLFEGLTGVTVGKLALGIRVVSDNGERPSFLQGVVRTAFRLIEVNPLLLGGLPAFLIVSASKNKQRLGDKLAGTYVVLSKDLKNRARLTSRRSETTTQVTVRQQ